MAMKKVRVTYKTPIGSKTGTMGMNDKTLKYYRSSSGKKFSPYKKITVLGDWKKPKKKRKK
jgi:hypothetical protein